MDNQTGRAENLKFHEYVDPYRNQQINQGITPGTPPQNYPPQTPTYYNQGNGGNNKGGKGPIIGIIILSIILIACIVVICLFVTGKFKKDTPTTESTTEITTETVTENINPVTAATTTENTSELTETTESTETTEFAEPADYDDYIGSDSIGYVGKPSYYETLDVPNLSNGVEEAVQAYDPNVNIYDDAESNIITLMLYNEEYSDMDTMTAAFETSLQDQGTVTKQNTTISGYNAVWFRVAVKDTTKILDMYLFKTQNDNQLRVLSIEYTPDNEFITDYKDTYMEKLYAPSDTY